jgi:hypothetical protein
MPARSAWGALAAIAALVAAAALGWWLGQPAPVVETPAAEQRQPDGSLVLERKPDAEAKPAHLVPAGAKVERVGRVTVLPAARHRDSDVAHGGMASGDAPNSTTNYSKFYSGDPCPPVTVDWSLVREPDGGRRMLASSPDGTIIGGVDVPIETAAPAKPLRWAAGVSWSPSNETAGVWLERDVPLFNKAARIGVDVAQMRHADSAAGTNLSVRLGIAF